MSGLPSAMSHHCGSNWMHVCWVRRTRFVDPVCPAGPGAWPAAPALPSCFAPALAVAEESAPCCVLDEVCLARLVPQPATAIRATTDTNASAEWQTAEMLS